MEDQTMTLEAFRQAKESGVDLSQTEVREDAAPQTIDQQPTNPVNPDDAPQDTPENQEPEDTDEGLEPLTKDQEPAFYKRMQRELKKKEPEIEERIRTQLEAEYNPYKAFFDRLGVDPQKAMEAIEQNRIQQEALQIAEQQGWTEQETQMYIRQQQLERKQMENDVALRVYELADTSDYPGIKQMKGAITEFIRANPRASVEQAYWAVGGQNLAQQLKREAEQREIAKRSQPTRTVVPDAPNNMKGPEPLPPEAVSFMKRTGMSEEQVWMMLKDEGPQNLDEYRKMMKRKG